MENNALNVFLILLSAGALITLIILVAYLLRIRARRRFSTERGLPWHFPTMHFLGGHATDKPPLLPLVLGRDRSSTSKNRSWSRFSRFSWYVHDDKHLSSEHKAPISYPEPVKVAWRRSGQDLPPQAI